MKTFRFITILIAAMLVLSAWTPSPVYAKADAAAATIRVNDVSALGAVVIPNLVTIKINNMTGGILNMSFTGLKSYTFTIPQGKSTIKVEPDIYTYTVTASACKGSYTKHTNFRGGGSLGQYYCMRGYFKIK